MPVEILVGFGDGTDSLIRIMNDSNGQSFGFVFPKKPVSLTFDPNHNILLKQASTIHGISPVNKPGSGDFQHVR